MGWHTGMDEGIKQDNVLLFIRGLLSKTLKTLYYTFL